MANSISDVKINVTVADVVSSCDFGIPLLYGVGNSDKTIGYTECYDINEVKEALKSIYVASNYNFSRLATGNKVLGSTITKTFDDESRIEFLPETKEFVVASETVSVDTTGDGFKNAEFNTCVKNISTDGYIHISTYTDSIVEIIAKCTDDDGEARLVIQQDSKTPAGGTIYGTYTVDGDAKKITIVGLGAGNYCIYAKNNGVSIYGVNIYNKGESAEVLINQATAIFGATTPPEKIAILYCPVDDIAKYAGYDWRQLIYSNFSVQETDDPLQDARKIAEIIETMEENKLFFFECCGGVDSYSNLPLIDELKMYERTVVSYSTVSENYCSALVGETSTKSVGSYTYKNIVLKHVKPIENIKNSQLTQIHDAGAFCCVTKSGYNVSSEGKTAYGEYIDVVDARDWIVMQMQYQLQQALIINDKVPYTNNGIALLESYCVSVLKKAYANGMIAENDDGTPAYTVDFAKRSETDASDRKARRYIEGKFTFDLAGAIHTVTVNGTINI